MGFCSFTSAQRFCEWLRLRDAEGSICSFFYDKHKAWRRVNILEYRVNIQADLYNL